MNYITISPFITNIFHNLFRVKVWDKPIRKGEPTDADYTLALDTFHEIADAIEGLIPEVATEDTDDVRWYDEYTDDIVEDFIHYLFYREF